MNKYIKLLYRENHVNIIKHKRILDTHYCEPRILTILCYIKDILCVLVYNFESPYMTGLIIKLNYLFVVGI